MNKEAMIQITAICWVTASVWVANYKALWITYWFTTAITFQMVPGEPHLQKPSDASISCEKLKLSRESRWLKKHVWSLKLPHVSPLVNDPHSIPFKVVWHNRDKWVKRLRLRGLVWKTCVLINDFRALLQPSLTWSINSIHQLLD